MKKQTYAILVIAALLATVFTAAREDCAREKNISIVAHKRMRMDGSIG